MKKYKMAVVFIIMLFVGCNRHESARFNGYVEGENIYLASPFYGALQKLAVVRGQHVEKGQLLFQLDANPQSFNYQQALAMLEQAQHTLVDLQKPKRQPEIDAILAQIEQAKSRIKLVRN